MMTPPRLRPALAVTAIASLLLTAIALPAPVAAEEPEPPADPGVVAAQQAAEEGHAVEVDEWTDEHSITHANPDGTFTLETGYEAARVEREGEWIPVDTAIEAAPDGRLRPAAAALDMDFSAGNDSHLATVTVDEHSLALHVPFTLTTPVITDDVITYPEVLPGVDLVVSVKPEEFSEVLVVKTAEAAANPVLESFDLRVETTNVDFTVNADGSSQATAADGETVFQSPPPYMWDSTTAETGDVPSATNVGETATPIALEAAPQPRARITNDSGTSTSTTVTLAPDAEALSGDDVQYPVYIDPLITVPKKVYVVAREGLPSYAENGDDLRVGYCTWTGCSPHYRARSYIAFDVWELMKKPDGTIPAVVGAKVTLTQTHAASSYYTGVRLARTTGPVDGTIVWPGPLGSALVTKNTKAGETTVELASADLTAYVNNLVYHQNGRLGFTLHAVNESDPYSWKKFRNNPTLTLTYGFPPKTPTGLSILSATTICNGATFVPTTTVKFGAHAVNYNIGTGHKVRLHFEIHTVPATTIKTISSTAVASSNLATATTTLAAGKYLVRARAEAVTGEAGTNFKSAFTTSQAFTVDPLTPGNPTAVDIWSTSHPHPAAYSDTGNGQFHLSTTGTDKPIGFLYAWGPSTSIPALNNLDSPHCPTASKLIQNLPGKVSGWVQADANGKAILSIPANARKDDNGNSFTTVTPIALKVKAVSQSGNILSTHTTYEPQVTPAGYHVMNLVPEDSIDTAATTATTATVGGTDSKLAGDAHLKVTATAGQQVTFEFELPDGPGNWLIQPDLNVPAGKAVTFAVNGADLGVSNRDEFNVVTCGFQTLTGDGTTRRQVLETSICTADATAATFTLTPGDGHLHTLTIKAPAGATFHIDQIRLVRQPV